MLCSPHLNAVSRSFPSCCNLQSPSRSLIIYQSSYITKISLWAVTGQLVVHLGLWAVRGQLVVHLDLWAVTGQLVVHLGLWAVTGQLVVHRGLWAVTSQLVVCTGPVLRAGTVQVVVYPRSQAVESRSIDGLTPASSSFNWAVPTTFPLSESKFQKIVLTKLVTLTDEVKKMQMSVSHYGIEITRTDTLEEFEREEAFLQETTKFETLVRQLARVWGRR